MKSLTLFLCLLCSPVLAEGLTEFEYDKLPFGTSIQQFKKQYPNSAFNQKQSDKALSLKSYIIFPSPHADAVSVDFFDGKLFSVGLIYYPARLNKMGGADQVGIRIIKEFGIPATERGPELYKMRWTEGDRRAEFAIIPEAAMLTVVDTAAERLLNERRSKSVDLGF